MALFFMGFFVYLVEAHMRANTQHTAKGHETRGAGVGRTKQWGTETLGDLWKGEGWGWGTWGIQYGHYRDFQEGNQGI